MNGQDYIRKAVELADGWCFAGPQLYGPSNYRYYPNKESGQHQVTIDALAAQLVRQVDRSGRAGFYSVPGAAEAQWEYEGSDELDTSYSKGPDRTMNTIKAIVDSGVLK